MLEICRNVARRALEETLADIRKAGRRFQELSGRSDTPVPDWQSSVYTVRELVDRLAGEKGMTEAGRMLNAFAEKLPVDMDEREKGLAVLDHLVSLVNLKGPAVVVGFLPPYYPQRINLRATEKECRLRSIMEGVLSELKSSVGQVSLVECFSGIMDLSYMGFQGRPEELTTLADNMPGWGTVFSLSMKDLMSLDVPIASVGPSGKDAHKDTERLELDYSFTVAPRMLERAIRELYVTAGENAATGSAEGPSSRP